MHIEIETTPNPATVKFLPGQTVMADGTRDFATPRMPKGRRSRTPCSGWATWRACFSAATSSV